MVHYYMVDIHYGGISFPAQSQHFPLPCKPTVLTTSHSFSAENYDPLASETIFNLPASPSPHLYQYQWLSHAPAAHLIHPNSDRNDVTNLSTEQLPLLYAAPKLF